jgi:acyl-CoA thioesterase-1
MVARRRESLLSRVWLVCAPLVTGVSLLVAGHNDLPVNPMLGEPGYPDCRQPDDTHLRPAVTVGEPWQTQLRSGEAWTDAAKTLVCDQNPKTSAAQLSVACVGDSITAGANLPMLNKNLSYPSQLQGMLGDSYTVTNLGACGSDMLKDGNRTLYPGFSPFWERSQFQALIKNKWDVVVIMLGTNDANVNDEPWPQSCDGASPGPMDCPFVRDYTAMIQLVRTLGTVPTGPQIHIVVPPALMSVFYYGMNQTVINQVYPELIRAINVENKMPHPVIDVFDALGGGNATNFPPQGCTRDNQHPGPGVESMPQCR